MNSKPTNKRLCVCLTPLHVLIAARLSERTGMQFDLGVYMAYQQDEKQSHYFNQMGEFCKHILFVTLPKEEYPRGLGKYIALFRRRRQHLKKFIELGRFSFALTSCSINHYLWCILQACKPARLETYDDGLLNIASTPRQHYLPTSLKEKLLLRLCGLSLNKDELIKRSAMHYTVYGGNNMFPHTQRIDWLQATDRARITRQPQVDRVEQIFICPSPEAPDHIWAMVEQHLNANPDMLYLPHPRGMKHLNTNSRPLETHLIIEDHVMRTLRDLPCRFKLVGTESSALINLANMDGVAAWSILPDLPEHAESRALMEQHGVRLLHKTQGSGETAQTPKVAA